MGWDIDSWCFEGTGLVKCDSLFESEETGCAHVLSSWTGPRSIDRPVPCGCARGGCHLDAWISYGARMVAQPSWWERLALGSERTASQPSVQVKPQVTLSTPLRYAKPGYADRPRTGIGEPPPGVRGLDVVRWGSMRAHALPSTFVALTLMASLGAAACGGAAHDPIAPSAEAPAAATPAPLERSLFSRDVTGSVSEDDLQRVLASRVDVTFPFRLGVVSLGDAFRAESEAPVGEQAIVASEVARAIKGSTRFTHVTDVSTELPNPAGIEGLRTIAARYRTRYLLVCSVRSEDRSHLNNWAWLYPTVVGVFLVPGLTVSSQGLMQASLLDVQSGTVLFTVNEPYSSSSVSWLIGSDRQHGEVDAEAMQEASKRLARSILSQTEQLAAWVEEENRAKGRVAEK